MDSLTKRFVGQGEGGCCRRGEALRQPNIVAQHSPVVLVLEALEAKTMIRGLSVMLFVLEHGWCGAVGNNDRLQRLVE